MTFGGRMDCCGQFVKYGLFIANFIIFIGGAVVFGLGVWTLVDRNFMNDLLGTNLFSGAVYILIVTSAITCLLSFLGCMGAAKEVKCLLLTYFIIVFLIFVTMLIGGILGYVFRERVTRTIRQEMHSSLKLYGSRREVTQAWDVTQTRLECCGVDDWRDWHIYSRLPESCCQETFGGQRKPCVENPNGLNQYTRGCLNVTTRFIRDNSAIIGGAGVGVAIIMILGLVLSCSLFNMIE